MFCILELSIGGFHLRKGCPDHNWVVVDKFVAENTMKGKLMREKNNLSEYKLDLRREVKIC